jgi:phytoene dehydrogenase-like protein
MAQFAERFRNPFLRGVFAHLWQPEMTAISVLFFLAYVSDRMNGFPIGGSLAMAQAVAKRYVELGGELHCGSRVEKVLVEGNRAVGVRLANGIEERADWVISAADGHATIWELLEGRFVDDRIRKVYEEFKLFPPLVLVGLGVNRTFNDLPRATGGIVLESKQPVEIGGEPVARIKATVYSFDPTLAPAGKTLVTIKLQTRYQYWKELVRDREPYAAEKERIARECIQRLDTRFPGFAGQVEVIDVATPATLERYTGNWQASFEGFLPTPRSVRFAIPNRLPGLDNFYMAGQWVRAGGGIPTGVQMGRAAVMAICKEDGAAFRGR